MGRTTTTGPELRFKPGQPISNKYTVDGFLGGGWEGEVYRVVENQTGIYRAAKFFYPERNPGNRTLRRYARKLERLAFCPLVVRYQTHETCTIGERDMHYLVSELNEVTALDEFVRREPGKRMSLFEALNLLHQLAEGLAMIHNAGEYHGDLHEKNVLIRRHGIGFEVKLIDFFHRGRLTREHVVDDVCDSIRIFYDVLGGQKRYAKLPREAKYICCGLKRSIISRRFRNAGALRQHLETFEWDE